MKRIKIYPILIFALGFCGFLLPGSASASEIRYYNVEASSVLYEPGYDHSAWCIDDDDLTTAWMEGADGHGNGEYVDIYTDPYTVVTGGIIYPGFYQDEDLFYKNNAPKMLYIRAGEQFYSDETSIWKI